MTPAQKRIEMVELLFKKTIEKDLEWREGHECVYVEGGNRIIKLIDGRTGDDNPLEIVEICNPDWSIIERFTDEDLMGDPSPWTGVQGYWTLLEQMREAAERQAAGVDVAIDDVLDWLRS